MVAREFVNGPLHSRFVAFACSAKGEKVSQKQVDSARRSTDAVFEQVVRFFLCVFSACVCVLCVFTLVCVCVCGVCVCVCVCCVRAIHTQHLLVELDGSGSHGQGRGRHFV
jgi:hypothetical protein